MLCDSNDSEKQHFWLKEGTMTILPFCALSFSAHCFNPIFWELPHTLFLSFSRYLSTFSRRGSATCSVRQNTRHLCLCWEHQMLWAKSKCHVSSTDFIVCTPMFTNVHRKFILRLSTSLLQLERSPSNYAVSLRILNTFGNTFSIFSNHII